MEKHRILVVDDDFISLRLIHKILEKKYSIDSAQDAQAAIALFKENDYSLLLIDINLGKSMSGIDLIRDFSLLKKELDIPKVAFTAYVMREDRQFFIKHGFTHFIAKPFKNLELTQFIDEIMLAKYGTG